LEKIISIERTELFFYPFKWVVEGQRRKISSQEKTVNEMNALTKIKLVWIAIMAICSTSLSGEPEGAKLHLVPYPQQVKFQKGVFIPGEYLILTYDKGHKEISQVVDTCVQDLAGIGFSASHGKKLAMNKASIIKLSIQDDQSLGKEGYRLKIDSKVSISAASIDGLFWGTRTLLQLMDAGSHKSVPQLTIIDQPEFGYRGLMIDNARRFHSIDFHIETIKRLSSFKLNRYQIHFSDHESYTLPSVAFPDLPTKNRHYTAEEVRKLVDVSRQYHVMIVPEIDVPGHSAALIRGIKNLGCDSYNGTRCKDCAARMKQENLKEGTQLYHYFINRMHGYVKSKGRQMLVWEGFSPDLDPIIHKDIIVCPFDVKHRGHMPIDYFRAGYKVLNTSWSPLYVADKIYMTTPEVIARWSPYMFGAGRSPQPFAYWKKFKPQDFRGKIIGGQMCSWAIEEKAEAGLLFGTGPGFPDYGRPGPRVQIMAERVWTGSGTTARDLLERVGASYW